VEIWVNGNGGLFAKDDKISGQKNALGDFWKIHQEVGKDVKKDINGGCAEQENME
jgi:hypothetical protein